MVDRDWGEVEGDVKHAGFKWEIGKGVALLRCSRGLVSCYWSIGDGFKGFRTERKKQILRFKIFTMLLTLYCPGGPLQ